MFRVLKKYCIPIIFFLAFETLAVTLWLTTGHIFFLFNFSYIGFFVSLGFGLITAGYKRARVLVQFFVGMYMLVFLGIINRENMQLEGFFYYAAMGTFYAAVLHYAVAKIFGPFFFGRAWCGYCCWTAMVLDMLPYKIPKQERVKKLELLRPVVFIFSFTFFCFVFIFYKEKIEYIMFISFIAGNLIYYTVGILLAFFFKDNRAFCKYACPITVFLKPASYFSLLRIKIKPDKCVSCGRCKKICPMNVDMLSNKRSRLNGTECILCTACVSECPKKALSI
jgi:polyferredoxin